MKILDIPQAGKRGLNVSQNGRYGQISRTLVTPTNPRTGAQMTIRSNFGRVTQLWRGLQEDQRLAWCAAAKNYQSKPSCGQSGPLTGSQLHAKINCTNLDFNADIVTDPPAKPTFGALAIVNILITNGVGGVVIKATCPTAPGDNTWLRASAPASAGRQSTPSLKVIGVVGTPAQGAFDLTSLYTAAFGVPPDLTKVYVQAFQITDGHESIPVTFSAIVPAHSE